MLHLSVCTLWMTANRKMVILSSFETVPELNIYIQKHETVKARNVNGGNLSKILW